MIEIIDLDSNEPYDLFLTTYKKALESNQKSVEAISISSFNQKTNEVNSRMVNLKYIKKNEWVFFSNYSSPKAVEFKSHSQISALLFWSSINTQIRINAEIYKTSADFSDAHFDKRSNKKNALAISSHQSKKISAYKDIVINYEKTLKTNSFNRPEYWGGYTFKPYYFEFWTGHSSRLNKRKVYKLKNQSWDSYIIQP